MVTLDGVVQHPSDKDTTRAYRILVDTVIEFSSPPGLNIEIQVRHLGFAGASTGEVSGFYGRTGNVVLGASDHITTGDVTPRNINASGIITASSFSGGFSGNIVGTSATFTGNLSVGGVLTYEDVTNVDSVGIITAQKDIHVGAGVSAVGVGTFGGIKIGNATLGNNGTNLTIAGGLGIDQTIFHNGDSHTGIDFNTNDRIRFRTGGYERVAFESSAASFAGGVNITQDLDVNGHTNLDNVSVAGVTTFSDTIRVGTGVTIETNGQAEIAGITTFYKDVHIKSGTNRLYLGTGDQLSLIADPSHSYLRNAGSSSHFQIHSNNFGVRSYTGNGSIMLFYAPVNDGSGTGGPQLWHYHGSGIQIKRLSTTTSGVNIVGTTTSTQLAITGVSTFTGAIDANGDLDVDGHTNLDNVSIAGVTTFSSNVRLLDNDVLQLSLIHI